MYVDRLWRNGKLVFYGPGSYMPNDNQSIMEMQSNYYMFMRYLEKLREVLELAIAKMKTGGSSGGVA